jgi:hypothetical protein
MRPTGVEPSTFGLKGRRQSRQIDSVSRDLSDPRLKGPAKGPKYERTIVSSDSGRSTEPRLAQRSSL